MLWIILKCLQDIIGTFRMILESCVSLVHINKDYVSKDFGMCSGQFRECTRNYNDLAVYFRLYSGWNERHSEDSAISCWTCIITILKTLRNHHDHVPWLSCRYLRIIYNKFQNHIPTSRKIRSVPLGKRSRKMVVGRSYRPPMPDETVGLWEIQFLLSPLPLLL